MTAPQDIDPSRFPIDTRDALPEALTVLLPDYPRAHWTRSDGFDRLTRVWLQRHAAFRRMLAGLDDLARSGMARALPGNRLAGSVGRQADLLVSDLRTHHEVEDSHYFPTLRSRDTRIARGFDILNADHIALETRLQRFSKTSRATVAALADGADTVDPSAALMTAIDGLSRQLQRHLLDEEDLVIPLLLHFGTEDLA